MTGDAWSIFGQRRRRKLRNLVHRRSACVGMVGTLTVCVGILVGPEGVMVLVIWNWRHVAVAASAERHGHSLIRAS